MSTIIIYGAGCQGRALLRLLKNRPEPPLVHCFLDADPAKQGGFVEGYPIHSPNYLLGLDQEAFTVSVAVGAHYPTVRRALEGLGLKEGLHFRDEAHHPITYKELNAGFAALVDRVRPHTLLSEDRLALLYQAVLRVQALPGDAAEVGVYKGGTAYLIAAALFPSGKKLHLFDTFCGIPITDPDIDLHRQGDFADISLEIVERLLKPFSCCRLHPGRFPETLSPDCQENSFSFVHVDVDIYQSAVDCCSYFYPRLTRGGIMIFDDYGFSTCPGIRRAVDEYFFRDPSRILYLSTGQALVFKN